VFLILNSDLFGFWVPDLDCSTKFYVIKNVWVRNGDIYIRRSGNNPIVEVVKNYEFVEAIFGPAGMDEEMRPTEHFNLILDAKLSFAFVYNKLIVVCFCALKIFSTKELFVFFLPIQ
jgi:hypothetical protein